MLLSGKTMLPKWMPTCGHLLKDRGYKGPFLSGVLPDKLFHMSRPNLLFQWEIKCVNSVKQKCSSKLFMDPLRAGISSCGFLIKLCNNTNIKIRSQPQRPPASWQFSHMHWEHQVLNLCTLLHITVTRSATRHEIRKITATRTLWNGDMGELRKMKTRGLLSVICLAPLWECFCQERRVDSRRNGKRFDAFHRRPLIHKFLKRSKHA